MLRRWIGSIGVLALAALLVPALALATERPPGQAGASGGGTGNLPMTGFDAVEYALLGTSLLVAGIVLLAVARRLPAPVR